MVKMVKNQKKLKKIRDFDYKETSFFRLLCTTQKWKELYNQVESKLSLLVSVIIIIILVFLFNNISEKEYNALIKELINMGLTTVIGLLGVIISGIAIFTGTITNKLVKNIDNDDKAVSLVGILFSFYYIGVIIGISTVLYIIMYLFWYSYIEISVSKICFVGFILVYLYFYSIFYSISLIGTCLKLFFVSYKFSNKEQQ